MTQPKSDSFDPYYKWLAIRPDQRPIHYYRLLGVEPFEDSNEVILNAAEQRMMIVRTFQSGPHAAAAARIMNEIAQAKVCLSDPNRRDAYDHGLRKLLAEQPGINAPTAVAHERPMQQKVTTETKDVRSGINVQNIQKGVGSLCAKHPPGRSGKDSRPLFERAPAAAPAEPRTFGPTVVVRPATHHGKARRTHRLGVKLLVLAVLIVVAAGLNYWMYVTPERGVVLAPDTPRSASEDVAGLPPAGEGNGETFQNDAGQTESAANDSGQNHAPRTDVTTSAATRGAEPDDDAAAATPAVDGQRAKPFASSTDAVAAAAKPTLPSTNELPRDLAALETDDRFDVPDPAMRRAAEKTFEETYRDDLPALKSAEKKAAFAHKLIENRHVVLTLPAELYVTLGAARKLAIDAGDVEQAVQVSQLVAKHFKSAPLAEREAVMRDLAASRGVVSTQSKIQLAGQALETVRLAIDADRLELAADMADLAHRAAIGSRYDELIQQVVALKKEVGLLRRSFAGLEKALPRGPEDEADLKCNATAGRWLCFVRGQWEQGRPLLAAGDEEALARLAKQDLQQGGDPQKQIDVADGWCELAAGQQGIVHDVLHARARYWYAEARPHVRGLARQRVEVRIRELAEQPPSLLSQLIDGKLINKLIDGGLGHTAAVAIEPAAQGPP